MTQPPSDRLRLSVSRLATLLSYWTPPRFSAAASPLMDEAVTALCSAAASAMKEPVGPVPEPSGSLADQLQLVVQVLADLGADAEGRPRRQVPRLPEPTALADQLTVVGTDALAAGLAPAALGQLADRLEAVRAAL